MGSFLEMQPFICDYLVIQRRREIMARTGQVKLFALSTCIWCKRTKALLDSAGIEYECYHLDQLSGAEKDAVLEEMHRYNPKTSYPTLVAGDEVVVGYDESKIREILGI
jgi:glutaredoxin-like protein NrdH